MSLNLKTIRWIIMDKDRTVIAKGTTRNRHLIPLDKEEDRKRILYYTTEAKAQLAFEKYGFYTWNCWEGLELSFEEERRREEELLSNLEAVEVEMIIREI